jgi:hypothetical protein
MGDNGNSDVRELVALAREREFLVNAKSILAKGGYTAEEIEKITAAALRVLHSGDVTKQTIEKSLVAAGCKPDYASPLASWMAN